MRNILLLFIIIKTIHLNGQSDLKIGQWRSYLPYHVGKHVTQSDTHLYYATPFAIMIQDKEDNSVQLLSKVEGLTDAGIGIIKYDSFNKVLIITYENGNMDLLKDDGRIVNIPFILTSSSLGDKSINAIYVDAENRTYLAMGFGLKVLDVKNEEFGDETQVGFSFTDVTVFEGYIYAASEEGLYRVSQAGNINIQDFNNWELMDSNKGFPVDYTSKKVTTYNSRLYIDIDDVLYSYQHGVLDSIYADMDVTRKFSLEFLTAEGDHLVAGFWCTQNDNACNGKVVFIDNNHNVFTSGSKCVNRPQYAIEDPNDGKVYYADLWDDFRSAANKDASCDNFSINSPIRQFAGEIFIDESANEVWVASEIIESDVEFSPFGIYSFLDGQWDFYNGGTHPNVGYMRAYYRLAKHPETGNMFIGTRWDGLMEFDRNDFTIYNDTNSTLDFSADPNRIRVNGLVFDADNNLWMSNHTAPKPLNVLRNDGTWFNDFKNFAFKEFRDIVIDQNNLIWIATDLSGVYVYDYKGTFDAGGADDEVYRFNKQNSQLPSDQVETLEIDLDNNVWVGTKEGVIVFECQEAAFDPSCQGTRQIVEVDGIAAYLLETEQVRTIAVDGANRKWFGTTNGVFVQSPTGEEQIAFFDVDNSPLFDNIINDIAINNSTGEVFIATAKGIQSLRTDALKGGNFHNSNVYAYPNPIQPEYNGPIAIKGLARDSNVKITDIEGKLVFETTALGGQAIWDGRDYNGRKASSGVYLVFATRTSNREVPEAVVTKILFLN